MTLTLKFSHLLSLPLICIFLCLRAYCFTSNGFEIRDLEANDTTFLDEIAEWSVSSPVSLSSRHTICNDTYFLGGYNILNRNGFFERTYLNLQPHKTIYFSINFEIIDDWTGSRFYVIYIDNAITYSVSSNFWTGSTFSSNICGNSTYNDQGRLHFQSKFPHTAFSLQFKVASWEDSPTRTSLGFRDVTFLLSNTTQFMAPCLRSTASTLSFPCKCPEGLYEFTPGQCKSCDSICESCYGPTDSECFKCRKGAFFTGQKCAECDSSCLNCNGSSFDQCNVCSPGYFLLESTMCVIECQPPLLKISDKICDFPCPKNSFLFVDGTCQSTCDLPLSSTQKYNLNFCSPPMCGLQQCKVCKVNDDCPQYHFCNTTLKYCVSYISYELSAIITKNIMNGYVVDVEVTPKFGLDEEIDEVLVLTLESIYMSTDYKASAIKLSKGMFEVTIEALKPVENGEISLNFKYSPSRLGLESKLAIPKINYFSPLAKKITEIVKTSSIVSFAILSFNTIGFAFSGGLSNIWAFLPENQYTYYLLYLNVSFLYHTETYLKSLANYNLLFAGESNQTENTTQLVGHRLRQSLPTRFIALDYSEDFRENVQQIIFMILIIIMALFFVIGTYSFLAISKRSLFFTKILHIMRKLLRWNGIVRQFLAYSLPIAMASFIQLHVSIFGKGSSTIALISSIVTLGGLLFGVKKTFTIIQNMPINSFELLVYRQWYSTLWEGLNLNGVVKYYYWIIAIRGILLVYLSVFFAVFPFLQISVLIIYQIGVVTFFFQRFKINQVFESAALNKVTMLDEIMILTMKITILIYLIFSSCDANRGSLILIGWIIIIPGIFSQIVQTLYSTYMQIKERKIILFKIKQGLKSMCKKKIKKKNKVRRFTIQIGDNRANISANK